MVVSASAREPDAMLRAQSETEVPSVSELVPYPFAALIRRMFRELAENESIFDLPARRFYRGNGGLDHTVRFHGHEASSPLGPAAGPQTQMAQNIVLSWLGGCRIMELKTVQILDQLEIPRPCIDMHTVGLNAEWSQELTLEQSLDEYVKGAMLIEMLRAEGERHGISIDPGFGEVVFDMSVGYDLEGIRSARVLAFIEGMLDATKVVDRLRREIPAEFAHLRDLDYATRLSDTLTLSTFHGCPPDEIEGIIDFLLREVGLHSIIKFNPMLLGREKVHELLFERLGYDDLEVPDTAFERDTPWEQAVEIVERLAATASSLGLGLGAKFSNTLIVKNNRGFLAPDEDEVYLSGEPLHVLAINLVGRFRDTFGDRFPISFSAGIDKTNYADAAALGLVPITVCTDLLRKSGYGRLQNYHAELNRRMLEVGAASIGDFVIRAYGHGERALGAALEDLAIASDDPVAVACRDALAEGPTDSGTGGDLERTAGSELYSHWTSAAALLNTRHYVAAATVDPRYTRARNSTSPRKIGSHLELFDCITCDICVPVCPNDANFTFGSDQHEIPVVKAVRADGAWQWRQDDTLNLARKHQIANFADFCNDCGHCDIFCPEDGGPYVVKPRFFGHESDWQSSPLDGFLLQRDAERDIVRGRFAGREYRIEVTGELFTYSGEGFELRFDSREPASTLEGTATSGGRTIEGEDREEVDLTFCHIMDYLRRAILDAGQVNYINSLQGP